MILLQTHFSFHSKLLRLRSFWSSTKVHNPYHVITDVGLFDTGMCLPEISPSPMDLKYHIWMGGLWLIRGYGYANIPFFFTVYNLFSTLSVVHFEVYIPSSCQLLVKLSMEAIRSRKCYLLHSNSSSATCLKEKKRLLTHFDNCVHYGKATQNCMKHT